MNKNGHLHNLSELKKFVTNSNLNTGQKTEIYTELKSVRKSLDALTQEQKKIYLEQISNSKTLMELSKKK